MKPAYYNDNDPYCAQWLRNLISAGHLPAGDVDDRPIQSVRADDLGRFGQCHFFAGIGGWPLALQLAGWTGDVWTGSCPCQPFSAAGKRRGVDDERHLWPEFARLIGERRPAVVLGEQVASRAGREWLAGVRADLEGLGYAVGGADLCAASAGAPHIRQRLYWVADAERGAAERGRYDVDAAPRTAQGEASERQRVRNESWTGSDAGRLADADQRQRGRVANGQGCKHDGPATGWQQGNRIAESSGADGWLGDAVQQGRPRQPERLLGAGHSSDWANCDWLPCLDGKSRRVESGAFPLAHGVPNRVGRLRGYGNAIVPQVAAQFVKAFMECRP